jgi:hypothetical protein
LDKRPIVWFVNLERQCLTPNLIFLKVIMNLEIDDNLLNLAVQSAPKENVLSFQQPVLNPGEIVIKPSADKPARKRFIIRSWIIDKFTTKRKRIELTPSVCDVCAFDVAEAKHGNWHHVPDINKADVLMALTEHKRDQHPVKEDLIVFEDEIATQWLGSPNTF